VPRPPRHQVSGSIYHVTTRGNDGRPIVAGGRDAWSFLAHLAGVVEGHGWDCLGYCLMQNHYHVLIRLNEPNLADGMAVLNGVWARRFNHRHRHTGHLFERRYRSRLIESEHHLLETLRYLPLNPVRARLCRHPRAWPWSSYRALAGEMPAPTFLSVKAVLTLLGGRAETARRRYVRLVEDGL
jgi:REP element-mobilizing transposase RayT